MDQPLRTLRILACALASLAAFTLARAESPHPIPTPAAHEPSVWSGKITWYGPFLAGRATASGETFDPEDLTMAHPWLPFGTQVRVTNPMNRRTVVVRVNDRGPFAPGRIADLSLAAARRLGMITRGVIHATLEILGDEPHGKEPRRNHRD